MDSVYLNIKSLLQTREANEVHVAGQDMDALPKIENAWLIVKGGKIHSYGPMERWSTEQSNGLETIDLKGHMVMPTWCDSHTHLVFANWREREFEDRIKGLSYEQIAERGGGILNSAEAMANADEQLLLDQAKARLSNLIAQGTGAIEIKSGYGLTLAAELKMLRVINELKSWSPIPVKRTFLGAHAYPLEFKNNKDAYIHSIVNEMIPAVAEEGLADYIDAFCETGYFSVEDTRKIIEAGNKRGLKAKVHLNQFTSIGGIQMCVDHDALSVDHLEVMTDEDFTALKGSSTYPVALPSCSFFLGIPYTPARQLMDLGMPLVLASDFNPGSTPSGNMNFVHSLACIKMKMTPAEAINAATLNGAAAMELSAEVGSISVGKAANFIVTTPVPSITFPAYAFGDNHIHSVYINGIRQ